MLTDTSNIVKEFVYLILSRGSKITPVLYYLPPSPPCRSILLLAKILNIELDLKLLNILEGEQMKPEFIQLNPQHCIPTLDDDGLVLWESRAILSYLTAAYAKDDSLYPRDLRVRALVDQRMQFDLGTLYARMADYYFPTIFFDAPLDDGKKAKLREAVGWLDAILNGRKYVAADHFTIADLTLLVTVSQLEAFGFEMYPFTRVTTWLERCKNELQSYEYEEINGSKALVLADMLRTKMDKN